MFLKTHRIFWFALCFLAGVLIPGWIVWRDGGTIPVWLFGRVDVLAIQLLSAVPTAGIISAMILAVRSQETAKSFADQTDNPHFSRTSHAVIGLTVILSMAAMTLIGGPMLQRSGFSQLLMTVIALVISRFIVGSRTTMDAQRSEPPVVNELACLGMALMLATVLPALYVDSASRSMKTRCRLALENQQWFVAMRYCQSLKILSPQGDMDNQSLDQLNRSLTNQVRQLQDHLNVSSDAIPNSASMGRRVTALLQLDRNEEALVSLRPLLQGRFFHPTSLDYYGLCHQRLGNPGESLRGYQRSIRFWQKQPESATRQRALISGWKGAALAARDLSDRKLEEQCHQMLLQLSPTAEHHYMMAKCYEEHLKSELAATHVREAVRIDPSYAASAEAMLGTMTRDHFGCFRIR